MKKEDINITLTDGVLTINAESKADDGPETAHWLLCDRQTGRSRPFP